VLACVAHADAQPERPDPHIGYLFPAGARQNSVVRVTIGGQSLRGVRSVYISGPGVHAKVLEVYPPLRKVTEEQR
jgi:hypothetical protein